MTKHTKAIAGAGGRYIEHRHLYYEAACIM